MFQGHLPLVEGVEQLLAAYDVVVNDNTPGELEHALILVLAIASQGHVGQAEHVLCQHLDFADVERSLPLADSVGRRLGMLPDLLSFVGPHVLGLLHVRPGTVARCS